MDFQTLTRRSATDGLRRAYALVAAALGAAFIAVSMGCGTVDVGPETGPPQPCDAPSAYFVSNVWPQYFQQYQCGQAACHNATTGRGFFRLEDVSMVTAPMPTDPQSVWPFEWQQNLRNVEQNLSCATPDSSLVLTVPSGLSTPHPPGVTITDVPAAELLFQTWLP